MADKMKIQLILLDDLNHQRNLFYSSEETHCSTSARKQVKVRDVARLISFSVMNYMSLYRHVGGCIHFFLI